MLYGRHKLADILRVVQGAIDIADKGDWVVSEVFWKIGSVRGLKDGTWTTVESQGAIIARMPADEPDALAHAKYIVAAAECLRASVEEDRHLLDHYDRSREIYSKLRDEFGYAATAVHERDLGLLDRQCNSACRRYAAFERLLNLV